MIGGRRRVEHDLRAAIRSMEEELRRVQDENARLRLERQRPVSPGSTAERLREVAVDPRPFSDAGDDAWAALAEVSVLRESLVSVCQELSTCAAQLERRLVTLSPAPELDRRAGRRRSTDDSGSTIDLRPAERSSEAPS